MARRSATLLLAPLAPLLLEAQGLPMLPPPTAPPALSLGELLPLRPLEGVEGRGAGTPFTWRGERVSEEGERWVLEQGAIQSAELLLLADRIRFDRARGEVLAEGNIRLEAQGLRLRCSRLRMDWKHQTGEAFALELELPPTWVLRSQRVVFATLRHWDFQDVDVSPCPQETPGWKARLAELKLDLDGLATLRHARLSLNIGGVYVPTYYLPWALYPAKAQRSSGVLPPLLGASGRLGATVGLSYFQTLGESADLTAAPEFFSREGVLWGGEARWNPEPTHQGSVQGQWIRQRSTGERRYRYAVKELWQREDGWQLSMDLNRASDALMDADFGRSVGRLGANTFDSAAYFGKSFQWFNFSLTASDKRSFFLPDDPLYQPDFPGSLTRRLLPQVEFRLYPLPVGRFYFDADLRVSRLSYQLQVRDNLPEGRFNWGRDDLSLRFYGHLGQWGPLRADFESLGRITRYGAALRQDLFDPDLGASGSTFDPTQSALAVFEVDGPGTRRLLGSANLKFSGPQVGRTFQNVHFLGYEGEVRHLLEPFVILTQTSRFGDAGRIARFDEVDIQPGVGGSAHGERSVELGLKQHFLGRKEAGTPFADLIRWRLGSRYHVTPILLGDGRIKKGWASIESDLDLEPHEAFRFSFKRSSDLGDGGSDNSLSAEYKGRDGSRFSLAAFSTGINRFLVRQKGIQLEGIERVWDDRLRLQFQTNYDLHQKGFSNSQVALAYVTPCVATTLRYSHLAIRIPTEKSKEDRLDLVITLRGLGDLFSFKY